jgi:hypothetical protein
LPTPPPPQLAAIGSPGRRRTPSTPQLLDPIPGGGERAQLGAGRPELLNEPAALAVA